MVHRVLLNNEMSWGDDVSLALAALQSPPEQAAKQALAEELKTKYGEIAKLNQAWSTDYGSWDALLQSRDAPDKIKARADLQAFYTRTAEQYFRTVREAIKRVAPNQLYLGCRFAWVNARAAAAAAKYCDVVSYNLYRSSVADFQFNGGADVPLIIGEFHFGALDRGMFHTGLVSLPDQNARAELTSNMWKARSTTLNLWVATGFSISMNRRSAGPTTRKTIRLVLWTSPTRRTLRRSRQAGKWARISTGDWRVRCRRRASALEPER